MVVFHTENETFSVPDYRTTDRYRMDNDNQSVASCDRRRAKTRVVAVHVHTRARILWYTQTVSLTNLTDR